MAKPRVFVSSTYYDLKYVRERLERFISAYCFDPILFESDEVFLILIYLWMNLAIKKLRTAI